MSFRGSARSAKSKDSHYTPLPDHIQNHLMPNVNFGDDVLFVKQFSKDCEEEKLVKIKFKAMDEVFGFVGGLFGFVALFFGAFLRPYSRIWFNIENSSLKEQLCMMTSHDHNHDGEEDNHNHKSHLDQLKHSMVLRKKLSRCSNFFCIALRSIFPSWLMFCRSG